MAQCKLKREADPLPFYSCPVEANDYVDKKFIHNYREKSANLKKKLYSARYIVSKQNWNSLSIQFTIIEAQSPSHVFLYR